MAEASCDLSSTIGTEVKEYNTVLILYKSNGLSVFGDDRGLYELISLISVIGLLNGFCSAVALKSFALCKSIVCKLNAVVVVIPVHCIITSVNAGNFTYSDLLHFLLKLCHKILSG